MKDIDIRLASEGDNRTIYRWRNDDLTRKMFRTSERIGWKEHCNWLTSALNNPNCCLLICEIEKGEPIAVVRFDVEDRRAELSINLSPLQRGKGFSAKCLSLAVNYFKKNFPLVSEVFAQIKTINFLSRKIFEQTGFVLSEEIDGYWYLNTKINA